MRPEELGRCDAMGPLDGLKILPHETAASSDQLGWVEGLSAAHDRALIHLDVNPGNLWLENERGGVKALDFCLARESTSDTLLSKFRPGLLSCCLRTGSLLY
jgi:serine/threonine protein kinase